MSSSRSPAGVAPFLSTPFDALTYRGYLFPFLYIGIFCCHTSMFLVVVLHLSSVPKAEGLSLVGWRTTHSAASPSHFSPCSPAAYVPMFCCILGCCLLLYFVQKKSDAVPNRTRQEMLTELDKPTDLRVYTIAQVLAEGSMTVDEIHDVSKIDHWFLRRLERIANFSKKMEVCSARGSVFIALPVFWHAFFLVALYFVRGCCCSEL